MTLFKVAVVFAITVGVAIGQRRSEGKCRDVGVKKSFDFNKYTGLWYEIEKIPNRGEKGLKCNTAAYAQQEDYKSVVYEGVYRSGKEIGLTGKVTVPDVNQPAKMVAKLDGRGNPRSFWVIDTDYEQYAVVYSCTNMPDLSKFELLWIFSRTRTLDDETKNKIYQVLDDEKIKRTKLEETDQDCD